LEEVDAELGRDPVTPVTLRRLRRAAKTSTEAASLLTALQRGDKVELRWHDESRGETFRSGRVVLKRRVALAPERSEKRSQRLYGDEEWWRLQDPDRDWWRLGPKPEPTWKL
jgi:hypothetical protein